VEQFRERRVNFTLMQCTSMYPCPPEKVGLNVMQDYRARFQCPVGLSDHSGTIFAGLAAAALGADVVEIHITFSRESFGPDVPASITTVELRQLAEGIRFIERMRRSPVDKDDVAAGLGEVRRIFRKSIVVRCALQPGEELRVEHLGAKKPGEGIPVERLPRLVGRRLKRAVASGAFLNEDDLD